MFMNYFGTWRRAFVFGGQFFWHDKMCLLWRGACFICGLRVVATRCPLGIHNAWRSDMARVRSPDLPAPVIRPRVPVSGGLTLIACSIDQSDTLFMAAGSYIALSSSYRMPVVHIERPCFPLTTGVEQ